MFAESFVKQKRVLDAGCGVGYGAALLAEFGADEVLAVDVDVQAIESARQNFARANVGFCVDDCEKLDSAIGQFDVVCNFENIEHLHNPEKFLTRVRDLLRDDGVLLCSSPDLRGPYQKTANGRTDNPHHVNEWHLQEFRELLAPYFGEIEMRHQVQTLAAYRRRIAAGELDALLARIWASPMRRLARGIQRLFDRRYEWPRVLDIANPSPEDYPIMASSVANLFGVPYCHVAVCRRPARPQPRL
jgi:SAM-dependent methyltransferase